MFIFTYLYSREAFSTLGGLCQHCLSLTISQKFPVYGSLHSQISGPIQHPPFEQDFLHNGRQLINDGLSLKFGNHHSPSMHIIFFSISPSLNM